MSRRINRVIFATFVYLLAHSGKRFSIIRIWYNFRCEVVICCVEKCIPSERWGNLSYAGTERPNKLVLTLPTLVLINNAYIFCNKPNFLTAITRRTLPLTVVNMAREKRREPPNQCATAFTEKLKLTTHRLCVCSYAYHVSYTLAFWKKRAWIFGAFFFLVIIPRNKADVRTNQGMDDCAAGGISQHSV